MPELDSGPWLFEDWLGRQDALTTYFRPKSVDELVAFLGSFPVSKLRVRGIGAGHSTSNVARPFRLGDDKKRAGIVVRADAMPLAFPDAAKAWWKPGVAASEKLVRVEAGASIAALNRRFFDQGLAFPNLGSYDQQQIAGAIATGTHGTGLKTGPLCDMVASIELVTFLKTSSGQPKLTHVRVEPADGPTDKAAFDAAKSMHGMELIREDDAFYSCVVGLGFFGIVTAITLRLRAPFWLQEKVAVKRWPEVAATLPAAADQKDYWYDFLLSTRTTPNGIGSGTADYKCLVTERVECPGSGWGEPRKDERRARLEKMHKGDPHGRTKELATLASAHPRIANDCAVETFVQEAAQPDKSASHHIFRVSIGDLVFASSSEVSIPLDQVKVAVDAIIKNNEALDALGLHHTSPFGVRFSQGSKHYLSMAYGRETCTIEAPMLLYSKARGGPLGDRPSDDVISEVLKSFVAAMRAAVPSARFHHGQRNWNTRADLEAYPKFKEWKAEYDRFNAFGVFSNEASEAWGL